jgi:glutamate N-acetyltransferase/amino-acid N-acetyltransferase
MSVDLGPLPSDLPPVDEAPHMPAGFRAGAVAAGIKASGRPDLGILATVGPAATAAAVFTTNRLPAAPVRLSRVNLVASANRVSAIVSTSGCANAATGPEGDRDQAELAARVSAALNIRPQATLALSTGLIGTRLPMANLREPLARLAMTGLATTDAALAALAEQLCTTDTRIKAAAMRLLLPAADATPRWVTVSGIAKGVGMIHPNMATMLAILLTDATVEPALLNELLAPAVAHTWNQLTVDGDMSTNDTVFLLASGASAAAPVVAGSAAAQQLAVAIRAIARSLARQQAADAEGATTLITCQVSGARGDVEARAVARAVVGSSLVKAAAHGRDPNWGRIAAAAGSATADGRPVAIEEARLSIGIAGVPVFAGAPLDFDRAELARLMDAPELLLRVDLGTGDGVGEAFGCDLTEKYVTDNSAYST